jgi:hypothetical protein
MGLLIIIPLIENLNRQHCHHQNPNLHFWQGEVGKVLPRERAVPRRSSKWFPISMHNGTVTCDRLWALFALQRVCLKQWAIVQRVINACCEGSWSGSGWLLSFKRLKLAPENKGWKKGWCSQSLKRSEDSKIREAQGPALTPPGLEPYIMVYI